MPRSRQSRNSQSMAKVTGYRFLDRDPIVDLCLYAMDKSGFRITEIAEEANYSVAPSTIRNLAYGKTRRPTHNTVRCIIEGCGGQEVFVFPEGHRFRVDYESKSLNDALKAANGKGWHGIEPIHPQMMRKKQKELRFQRKEGEPKALPAPKSS